MAHLHDVLDNDKHFIIDAETRAITFAGENLPTLIQNDHNSERFTFEIPKDIDGHNTELCNKIRVHYINVSAENPLERSEGIYDVDDIKVAQDDKTKMIFSWLLGGDSTMYVGTLTFLVECMCVDSNNVADYKWHTGIFTGAVISEGMDCSEAVIGKYYDVVEQWLTRIEAEGNRVVADALARIDNAAKEAKAKSVGDINAHSETVKKDLTIHGLSINGVLVNETGSSENKVMSQKATTEMGNALEAARVQSYTELTGRLNAAEETIDDILINNTHRAYISLGESPNGRYDINGGRQYTALGYALRSAKLYCTVCFDYSNAGASSDNPERFTREVEFDLKSDDKPGYTPTFSTIVILNIYLYKVEEGLGEYYTLKCDYMLDGICYSTLSTDAHQYIPDYQEVEICQLFIDEIYNELYLSSRVALYEIHDDPSLVNAFRIEANGIRNISKTSTESVNGVTVNTYTILLDDGTTKTFEVRDGVGISDFAVIEYGDYEDTYRIEFTNGTAHTFKVPNNNSVGIRHSESGAMIHATDLTHLEHTVKAKVRSKNMIPYPYNDGVSKGMNGITFTVNEDGSISAYGTATETAYMILGKMNRAGQTPIAKGKYILSGAPGNGCVIAFGRTDNQGESRRADSTGNEKPLNVEVVNDTTRFDIVCTVYAGTVIPEDSPVTFYPQLEEGDAVTPYTPYVDPSSVTLRRCGKNLLPITIKSGTTIAGITITTHEESDGTCKIVVNGTATASPTFTLFEGAIRVKGTYTLSGMTGGSGTTYYIQPHVSGVSKPGLIDGSKTYEDLDGVLTRVALSVVSGTTLDNLTFYLQLEPGSEATEYEPYVGQEYGIASDGKPVTRVTSLHPTMNLLTDMAGTIIDATYNIDQTAAYNKINALLEAVLNGGV